MLPAPLREFLSHEAGPALSGGAGAVCEEPGGGRLLFRLASAGRGIRGALAVAAPDGREVRILRPVPAGAPVRALWLGRDAIACSCADSRPPETVVIAPDGRELARVWGRIYSFDPASGRGLICDGDRAVLNLWEPRHGTVEALVHAEELAARLPARAVSPGAPPVLAEARWSGDGRRILALLAGQQARPGGPRELFVLETAGVGCRHLGPVAGDAQWSDDGATVFARMPRDGALDLVAFSARGGPPRVVRADFPGCGVALAATAARAVAAVPRVRGGATAVVLFDLVGGTQHRLAVTAGPVAPQPGWSADGSRIFALLRVRGRLCLCALHPPGGDGLPASGAGQSNA